MKVLKSFPVAVAVILCLGVTALADTFTFVAQDGKWNVADNWQPAGHPDGDDTVIIPVGKRCRIEDQDEAAYMLIIDAGGRLVLDDKKLSLASALQPLYRMTINGDFECKGNAVLRIATIGADGSGCIYGARQLAHH